MPVTSPVTSAANTRTQKRQTNILNVATELFLERGYDAVSLDDVVERTGGSKTTLYSYYGGKEGLFAAIVQKACEDKLAPLLEQDVTGLHPKAGLSSIGRLFISLISNPAGCSLYRMMIAEAERFPDLASAFYAAGPKATVNLLQRHIEHWQKKSMLRSGNSETLAVQFIGIMLGNFSVRHLLGLSSGVSEREIGDWVESGVVLFLEGASGRHN